MRFAQLLTRFYFEPWYLRPDVHSAFGQILQQHLAGDQRTTQRVHAHQTVPYQPGRPIVGPVEGGQPLVPQMTVEDGVAIIPVWGVLGKRLDWLELYCGGCDYEHVAAFAQMALTDPTIESVIFDFNSPGGMAQGIPEIEPTLAELSAAKPTLGYTDTQCCSAAYRLAAHCREIYASPSAAVGSIGTVLAAVDNSKEWENKGWVLELFASGALKAIGMDGKKWTDAERNHLREKMERKQAQFLAVMSAYRPQVAAESMQGQWFDGDEAESRGLVDGLANTLAELTAGALLTIPREPESD